jgi:hypothetical protein
MTRDRIDALADALFAAAREERPDRELCERVQRATATANATNGEATESAGPAASAPLGPSKGAAPPLLLARSNDLPEARTWPVRRPVLFRALLAASVCGGVAAFLLPPRTRDAVLISAERSPGAPTAKPMPAAKPVPAAPAPVDEGHAEEPRPAAPTAPAAPSPESKAPRARAAPRPRGADAPPAALSAAPEAAAEAAASEGTPANERPPGAASTPTLSNELGVLKQIRQALRGHDGQAALALLDRYATGEYGTSLSLEASVLRVEALDAVGRRAEAEALARRFVRDNPDSPLAERAQSFIDETDPARPGAESSRP